MSCLPFIVILGIKAGSSTIFGTGTLGNPLSPADHRLPGSTVCPRRRDSFYIVTYYIEWVTTFWTYSTMAMTSVLVYVQQL